MLATHPKHNCHYTHLGFDITCAPPWHFFGWFFETQAPGMQRAARETATLLRFGERVIVNHYGQPPQVEVWVHEDQTDLTAFWLAVSEGKSDAE